VRILVGSVPVIGHINPLVPIVRALCARGHEVCWYTGAKYRAKVEATGARFAARIHARDYDDARIESEFPGRANLRGIAQLKFDMKHVFIDNAPGSCATSSRLRKPSRPTCSSARQRHSAACSTPS
jgi:UDP:flavonoid glycosyltransferase YjiC (YdhE family)